jgi:hypothetical protein
MKTNDSFNARQTLALNARAHYLNTLAPLLIARFKEPYKLKADGSLYKKDQADFKAIIESVAKPDHLRAYIDCSEYSIYLKVDISYKGPREGWLYNRDDVFLADPKNTSYDTDYSRRALIDLDTIPTAQAKRDELGEQIRLLKDEQRLQDRIIAGSNFEPA